MHALIQNDTITHIGPLPRIWWDGDRWHDLRDDDGTYAASLGWLPIQTDPRPADTATATWERAEPALVDGLPVVGWTERPKTEAEQVAEAEQSARLDDLVARVARIEAHLWPAPDDPATLDDPTVADWAALGGIWPDQGLLREGGIIWRNVSGVPLTTPPSGFPGEPSQWAHLFVAVLSPEPDPDPDPDPDPTVADFVQPTGQHDAYQIGDRVRFDGKVWESTIANNVWSPTDYPAGWKLIG